jgi:hypothetical protein
LQHFVEQLIWSHNLNVSHFVLWPAQSKASPPNPLIHPLENNSYSFEAFTEF